MKSGWIRQGIALSRGPSGACDCHRAWQPWVIEEPDGRLRMWYCGSDGTTSRILEAAQDVAGGWAFDRISIDVGAAGDSDSYGVEAPSVIPTPGGYFMAYAGFDGNVSRIHAATSTDGRVWRSHGPMLHRSAEDALAAEDPAILVTGERWWLFCTGRDGTWRSRTSTILAAISDSGASWDRIGTVLEPADEEMSVSHPCVIQDATGLAMFYASRDQRGTQISLATSRDGVLWNRRGSVVKPMGHGPDGLSVETPCVLQRRNGTLSLFYSGLPIGDTDLGYDICIATFPGRGQH